MEKDVPSVVYRSGGGAGGAGARESLLVLSDIHLGSDLHAQAERDGFGRRSKQIDRDLVQMLSHYRGTVPAGDRWRVVIAGDFIDFIGMSIDSADLPGGLQLDTEPSEEEREHGLGNAADHARLKMQRVAERHPDVFAALAGFVRDGHALTIVHGNHDVEFHWDAVKSEFRKTLLGHAQLASPADEEAFAARIEFNPWFFYVNGVAYIEHGHQYDPFCATDTFMAPLSPVDPRRIMRGFCDVLLRFVVRPTRGLKEHGHESMGVVDYLRFGSRLGVLGMLRLGGRFALAVVELFRLRRAHFSEAARALKAEHERRVALLAEATRIGADRLRALMALQTPPLTRSASAILASVLLDRLALGMVALLALLMVGLLGLRHGHAWYGAVCILVAWAGLHRHLTQRRVVDPAENMVERAAKLASLFPAAFVVMGHTHTPLKVPLGGAGGEGKSTYINLGSWAEEEAGDEPESKAHAYAAPRTHLVIHPGGGPDATPVAEFLRWEPTGPQQFGTGVAPVSDDGGQSGSS